MSTSDLQALPYEQLVELANQLADKCRLASERTGDDTQEWARFEPVLLELSRR